jgi:hypothetical protein
VAVKLAAERGIPTAILNPDAIPGKANQYLMRYAMAVCCQFDVTAQHVSAENRGKLITTGCPIRPDILQLPPREEAAARLMIEPNLQTLMITGASQGAKTVNEAALELFKTITLRGWQVLHLSGREHAEGVAPVIGSWAWRRAWWISRRDGRCLGGFRSGHQPLGSEQLRRADGLRRALDSHALSISQGYAPARQCEGAGPRRRGNLGWKICAIAAKMPRRSSPSSNRFCTIFPSVRRWRRCGAQTRTSRCRPRGRFQNHANHRVGPMK